MKQYKLNTYGGYLGEWYCKITYPIALGNSGEAQAIMAKSISAAKRAIRREIIEREAKPVRRLKYQVKSNDLDAMNRLHGLVIMEA